MRYLKLEAGRGSVKKSTDFEQPELDTRRQRLPFLAGPENFVLISLATDLVYHSTLSRLRHVQRSSPIAATSSAWSASSAARIIRFTRADSFGHAATSRANSGSASAADINRSQAFSTVSVATFGATERTRFAFRSVAAGLASTPQCLRKA